MPPPTRENNQMKENLHNGNSAQIKSNGLKSVFGGKIGVVSSAQQTTLVEWVEDINLTFQGNVKTTDF